MSKLIENLRDQATRARRLAQTVSDQPSAEALTGAAQKYEDDANMLELTDPPAADADQKAEPPGVHQQEATSD